MTDMLVKLYDLPPLEPVLAEQAAAGVAIRRVIAAEKHLVLGWVGAQFNAKWASECDIAYHNRPPSCWIAVQDSTLLGFACYDTGFKGIWGPTGVSEAARGRGIGKALLIASMHDMRAQGYGYAVIGWTGPQEFYAGVVGATPIEGSRPGIFRGLLLSE